MKKRPLRERIMNVGIDPTDYCDACGRNNGQGVLFNPGRPSLITAKGVKTTFNPEGVRNFAVCIQCLVSAMHVRMPPNPPYDQHGRMTMIVPIVSDEVGALVWYLQAEEGKALYLDNGTGTYPGERITELPMRGSGKREVPDA